MRSREHQMKERLEKLLKRSINKLIHFFLCGTNNVSKMLKGNSRIKYVKSHIVINYYVQNTYACYDFQFRLYI